MEDIFMINEREVTILETERFGRLAYVEVGAVVDGWLHFMDHPAFQYAEGAHPSQYMKAGDRVRAWVADVNHAQQRIKLTANRPAHLPGPRRVV